MALGLWNDQAFVRNMFSESLAATVVFFGSALWFKRDDPRHEELLKFEEDLKRPAFSEAKGFDPAGLGAYVLIGRICFILGAVLIACVLIPSTQLASSSLNVVAGIMLLGLGAATFSLTKKRSRKPL